MFLNEVIAPVICMIDEGGAQLWRYARVEGRWVAVKSHDDVNVEASGSSIGREVGGNDVLHICPYLFNWLYLRSVWRCIDELPVPLVKQSLDFRPLSFWMIWELDLQSV